jgi:hypothetical protein
LFLFEDLTNSVAEREGWVNEEVERLREVLAGGLPGTIKKFD